MTMFKLATSYDRNSLISVCCQCSMRTAFTENMAEEVFNVVIVNHCQKKSIGSGTGIVLKVPV